MCTKTLEEWCIQITMYVISIEKQNKHDLQKKCNQLEENFDYFDEFYC